MMSINFEDIAIWNIHDFDFRFNFNGIKKSEAINVLQNAALSKKRRTLQK